MPPTSPPDYLIDEILPAREVHLLAGVSGAGKTSWLFDTMLQWEQGLPVLGHTSHPVPWAYVAADRSVREADRTLTHMGYKLSQIPIIPAFGAHKKTWNQIIDELSKRKVEFAIIEAFGKFIDGAENSRNIYDFLSAASRVTDPSREFPRGLTIMGIVESPKLKPNERYKLPRQRVSGASAWAHYSSSIFLIEHVKPEDNKDPRRRLYVCPRTKETTIEGGWKPTGRLTFP